MHTRERNGGALAGLSLVEGSGNGLKPGEVYTARVSCAREGQVELELGDSCLVADTRYRFRVGDRVTLRYIGSHAGQIRFELALPSGASGHETGMLRTLALAVGAEDSSYSHGAMDLLLRHALPLTAENVNQLAELQKRGCLFSPGFMSELGRIWSARLKPSASMLSNYSHWRERDISLSELVRESVEFEQMRNSSSRGQDLAKQALIGYAGQPVDQRSIGISLRSLYGGANDPLSLGQLRTDDDLRRNFSFCRLLDILAMQCLLATLDGPRMSFVLPMASRCGDRDVRLQLTLLGRRNYRERYSCIIGIDNPVQQACEMQVGGYGDEASIEMLSGSGEIAGLLRKEPEPRVLTPARMMPAIGDMRTENGGFPGFAQRIPAGLHRLLARLSVVLQERC
ncbi:hypothetical protein KDL29_01540 [bacterium]|nr:hypothetical protein [bacterium]